MSTWQKFRSRIRRRRMTRCLIFVIGVAVAGLVVEWTVACILEGTPPSLGEVLMSLERTPPLTTPGRTLLWLAVVVLSIIAFISNDRELRSLNRFSFNLVPANLRWAVGFAVRLAMAPILVGTALMAAVMANGLIMQVLCESVCCIYATLWFTFVLGPGRRYQSKGMSGVAILLSEVGAAGAIVAALAIDSLLLLFAALYSSIFLAVWITDRLAANRKPVRYWLAEYDRWDRLKEYLDLVDEAVGEGKNVHLDAGEKVEPDDGLTDRWWTGWQGGPEEAAKAKARALLALAEVARDRAPELAEVLLTSCEELRLTLREKKVRCAIAVLMLDHLLRRGNDSSSEMAEDLVLAAVPTLTGLKFSFWEHALDDLVAVLREHPTTCVAYARALAKRIAPFVVVNSVVARIDEHFSELLMLGYRDAPGLLDKDILRSKRASRRVLFLSFALPVFRVAERRDLTEAALAEIINTIPGKTRIAFSKHYVLFALRFPCVAPRRFLKSREVTMTLFRLASFSNAWGTRIPLSLEFAGDWRIVKADPEAELPNSCIFRHLCLALPPNAAPETLGIVTQQLEARPDPASFSKNVGVVVQRFPAYLRKEREHLARIGLDVSCRAAVVPWETRYETVRRVFRSFAYRATAGATAFSGELPPDLSGAATAGFKEGSVAVTASLKLPKTQVLSEVDEVLVASVTFRRSGGDDAIVDQTGARILALCEGMSARHEFDDRFRDHRLQDAIGNLAKVDPGFSLELLRKYSSTSQPNLGTAFNRPAYLEALVLLEKERRFGVSEKEKLRSNRLRKVLSQLLYCNDLGAFRSLAETFCIWSKVNPGEALRNAVKLQARVQAIGFMPQGILNSAMRFVAVTATIAELFSASKGIQPEQRDKELAAFDELLKECREAARIGRGMIYAGGMAAEIFIPKALPSSDQSTDVDPPPTSGSLHQDVRGVIEAIAVSIGQTWRMDPNLARQRLLLLRRVDARLLAASCILRAVREEENEFTDGLRSLAQEMFELLGESHGSERPVFPWIIEFLREYAEATGVSWRDLAGSPEVPHEVIPLLLPEIVVERMDNAEDPTTEARGCMELLARLGDEAAAALKAAYGHS